MLGPPYARHGWLIGDEARFEDGDVDDATRSGLGGGFAFEALGLASAGSSGSDAQPRTEMCAPAGVSSVGGRVS